ncbi:glutamine synthetase, partial [Streptomyces bacillaris]
MTFKAEYIWIDGTEPTAKLRSKTKIMDGTPSGDVADLPIWGFDGSSTNQAEGHASDRVLKPVFSCPDPIRGGDDILVLCEVFNIDMTPHESNTRAALRPVAEQFAGQAPIFG